MPLVMGFSAGYVASMNLFAHARLGRWFGVVTAILACAAGASAAMPASFNPERHMGIDDVRPGMRGYGLTVFQGTKPEPFTVEVVSVEHGFAPGKSVVWVRCLDERMQKTGPVSGMSGSPIFLWADSRSGDWSDFAEGLKRGPEGDVIATTDLPGLDVSAGGAVPTGRMLGAFAFGYSFGKDCYVGVQPIEQMLAAGERAEAEPGKNAEANRSENTSPPAGNRAGSPDAVHGLIAALRAADRANLPEARRWRMDLLAEALDVNRQARGAASIAADASQQRRMYLPVAVGSSEQAAWLRPFLEPVGLRPVANETAGGRPPNWIDPESVAFEPGGVASIPLVSGDMDLPAVGTVTEVLPDGTVLAFGHALFGQGEVNVPLATGYVHFIQPSIASSFKMGGSLRTRGAVVNDENTAVVGRPNVEHDFRPATVRVRWPDASKNRTFEYQLTNHPVYLPLFAAMTVGMSVSSDTQLPEESSMRLTSRIDFGQRELTLERTIPRAGAMAPMAELLPAIVTLADSPFERQSVQSIDTTVEILPEVQQATIERIVLRKSVVAPGESVRANITFRPFRGRPVQRQVRFPIAKDTPEGRYRLLIGSSQEYQALRMETQPHRMRVAGQDDLFDLVRTLFTLPDDALYMMLTAEQPTQTALGRTELPDLPSSRAAMIQSPRNTSVSRYFATREQTESLPWVIEGGQVFQIEVRKRPLAANGQRGGGGATSRPGGPPVQRRPGQTPDVPIDGQHADDRMPPGRFRLP